MNQVLVAAMSICKFREGDAVVKKGETPTLPLEL
jgi:hypothetical protein